MRAPTWKAWTRDEEFNARTLWSQKFTVKEIAKFLGRTPNSVCNKLRETLGFRRRTLADYAVELATGEPLATVAMRMRVTVKSIRRVIIRLRECGYDVPCCKARGVFEGQFFVGTTG